MNKLYTKIYFIVWIFLTSMCFAGKIFFIPLLKDISIIPLLMGIFLITGIILAISGIKIFHYLKTNYKEKWAEIIDELNTPWISIASYFPDDKRLLEMQEMHRRCILVLLFSFFSIPIVAAILVVFNIKL